MTGGKKMENKELAERVQEILKETVDDGWSDSFFKIGPGVTDYQKLIKEGQARSVNFEIQSLHRTKAKHLGPIVGYDLQLYIQNEEYILKLSFDQYFVETHVSPWRHKGVYQELEKLLEESKTDLKKDLYKLQLVKP